MWMMGYNDAGEFNMPADSFSGRKLRPLIPRPLASTNNITTATPPCLSRLHGADFLSQYHHLGVYYFSCVFVKMRARVCFCFIWLLFAAAVAEQSKKEFNTPPVVVSSRWNPTPEQITAQLRRYGKIEGKNVFYWFQNHKARERQKRRRQMESASDTEILERKELGKNPLHVE